jgi:hypothetical protein
MDMIFKSMFSFRVFTSVFSPRLPRQRRVARTHTSSQSLGLGVLKCQAGIRPDASMGLATGGLYI